PKDEYTKNEWTAIGRCGNDVRLLDVAKIDEETKQLPDALRIAAREQVAYARLFYAHLEQSAKPTVDKDPDYKRLLYDVPQAAWKKWEADAKKYQKELDAALKFEDQFFGPSTKAYEGCYEALRPHVQRYVKASKVKSFQGFVDAMSEPIGYVLASSFGSCMAVTDGWAVGAVLLNQIKGSRVWRGPRVAVGFAMLEELNRILEDRTRFPVLPSWVGKEPRNLLVVDATDPPRTKIARSGTYLVGETQGVVKAAKKTREKTNLVVDFKAETWMQPTSTCKSTGEIYKITSYGEVIYKQNCRFTGMRKRSFTPARTGFVAKTAMGIRPNSFIRFVHEAGAPPGQVRYGWPMEVYKTKKKKVLTNVFGFTP
ncbi:MAG: hypothetical protein HKN10_18275, partial [Myxococcales bacterium]|nr:hypothetical protein [Myxococcales bacterium]